MHRNIQRASRLAGAAGLAVVSVAAMQPVEAYSTIRSIVTLAACSGAEAGRCDGGVLRKPEFAQAPGSPIKVGPMTGRPTVADMNRDGHADIVVSCGTCCGSRPREDSGHVVVLLGDGTGAFKPAGERVRVGPGALKVAIGDANGDGNPDALAIEHDTDNLTVLLGDGKGALALAPGSPFVHGNGGRPHTHDLALADINADGALDAVVTRCNDNRLGIMLGDGKGGFRAAPPVAAGRHPYEGLQLRDVTGDGKLDAVVPNLHGDAVSVLAGDGQGGFAQIPGSPFKVGPRPGTLAIGDLNSDGRDDIAVTHDDDPLLAVLLADGRGGFAPASGSPFTMKQRAWGLEIGDFDGDSINDLAGACGTGHVALMRSDGSGGFTSEQ